MTKPVKIAVGIAVACACCVVLAATTGGVWRVFWLWTAVSCAIASAAYVANQPEWLGKRAGRFGLRALPVLPYLAAFRIACTLMRWGRERDVPTEVASGLWVSGRVRGDALPSGVTRVVDLVAEYPAARDIRWRDGYRCVPVLDGGYPPEIPRFLGLVRELTWAEGDVLVHCDSGRGRAPTLAAALVIARGLADTVGEAVALVRMRRAVSAPTRSDVRFLEAVLPALRQIAGEAGPAEPLPPLRPRIVTVEAGADG